MYRCKRFVAMCFAIFFSLALIASMSLSVFADTDDDSSPFVVYFQWIRADGTTSGTGARPIQEGFLLTSGYIGIRIIGFGYKPIALNTENSVSLSVRFSGYSSNPDVPVFQLNVPDSSVIHEVTSWSSGFVSAPTVTSYGTGRGFTIDSDSYYPTSKTCTFQIQFNSKPVTQRSYLRFNLATPYDLKAYQTGYYWWPYLDSIWFEILNQQQIDFYPSALSSLTIISNFISSLANRLLAQVYSWQQISYNPVTEEFDVEQETGNYYDALLGSIQSLNADALAQAVQQNKAKEAGAEDALDAAYDHSSFGAFIDILDVGDFGDYDEDVVEDAADGPFDWFSDYNRMQLDMVADNKKGDDDFVSFYQGNIDSIQDILSGNRAARRKAGDE